MANKLSQGPACTCGEPRVYNDVGTNSHNNILEPRQSPCTCTETRVYSRGSTEKPAVCRPPRPYLDQEDARKRLGMWPRDLGGMWWPGQKRVDRVVPAEFVNPTTFDTDNYSYQVYARPPPVQCPPRSLAEVTDERPPLRYNVKRIAKDKPVDPPNWDCEGHWAPVPRFVVPPPGRCIPVGKSKDSSGNNNTSLRTSVNGIVSVAGPETIEPKALNTGRTVHFDANQSMNMKEFNQGEPCLEKSPRSCSSYSSCDDMLCSARGSLNIHNNNNNNNNNNKDSNNSSMSGRPNTKSKSNRYPLRCQPLKPCPGKAKGGNSNQMLCRPARASSNIPHDRILPCFRDVKRKELEPYDEDKHGPLQCRLLPRCSGNKRLDQEDPLFICEPVPKPKTPPIPYGSYKIVGGQQRRPAPFPDLTSNIKLPPHLEEYREFTRRCPNFKAGRYDRTDVNYEMLLPSNVSIYGMAESANPFLYMKNPRAGKYPPLFHPPKYPGDLEWSLPSQQPHLLRQVKRQ